MVYGQVLHARGEQTGFVNLNVGGYKQQVDPSTLLRFPQTRLGRLLACHSEEAILELCDDYNVAEKEYYFDRNPRLFLYVLNFYHTGKMHLMEELCVLSFSQEIEYWGIKELHLDSCCSNRFHEQKEYAEENDWERRSDEQQHSLDSSFEELSLVDKDLEKFEGSWCSEVRKSIWLRLENPGYSCSAKLLAVASLCVVITSIIAMCVHSMPEFQRFDANEKAVEDPVLEVFEIVCVLCFSVEFLVRLLVTPCLCKFLSSPLNIIDFVSVVPFYATLAFDSVDEDSEENADLENVGKVVQVLRLMRIFRILKLARHSVGLRSLGATLRHSYHEVGLLVLFLSVGISIFSVLIYFVEKEEEESELHSIPVGWWWATISMTTVGYGDTYPVSLCGKIIATVCIICGLLVVALPITVIFNKFSKYYQRQKCMGQGTSPVQGPPPDLPYFNIRDSFGQEMRSFLSSVSSRGSGTGSDDDTDASEFGDLETVCRFENRSGFSSHP
ncbi:potassium voltage-gated channel subfamily S member 3a [Paramormyrops kingsleyae]|uniref:potassium voltage-gated channel subfamily S member 3a n=1 Tax=Paramormyrops kingsleyae TaxID=1676925 RepID=UPI000CD62438|nr:potassium voltage-gated channel subfamily S member 3-like [Paramormyrops kingsleyae]XP_023690495.1 potassium voltage-gated channel subfamily S member 3-like [Paramormyrops kingsleyae]XP_023690496.1 potassium voltage-gated channel subfamily S member 3-like [Paramormyrops kingsleyae]XP_023690497.1 potassium voltage-gated channel subfamily S member 3-like [Paramormyrops kingsleyae]